MPGRELSSGDRRNNSRIGRCDAIGGFNLLEFELVAPGNQGAPDKLVGRHHDQNHHRDSTQQRAHIARVGRRLHVTAQAGKLEVTVSHGEHLAEHQGEPAAGHRNNRIPHQPDGGIGHFQLPEALPSRKAVDVRGLDHLPRNGLERRVETERQVPNLTGEDEENDPHFDAQLMSWHQRHHGQHHRRQKTQHRYRLQDVENGDHPGFDPRMVRGGIAVTDGKDQAQQVSQGNAHNGIKRIHRQRPLGMGNGNHRNRRAHPVPGHVNDAEENRQPAQAYAQVDDQWPGANRDRRSGERVLDIHSASSSAAASSSFASGNTKRRREASKSNISA